jgi:hypothetical protein
MEMQQMMEMLLKEIRAGQEKAVANSKAWQEDGYRKKSYQSKDGSDQSTDGHHVREDVGSQYECLAGRDDSLLRNDGGVSRRGEAGLSGHKT